MSEINDSAGSTHPNLRQVDDSEFADDFGEHDFGPWYLTEDEERYRAAAYAAVLHYTRDYGLAVLPVWWMRDEQTCACPKGAWCESIAKHPVDMRWPEAASDDPEHAARWWRPPEPDQTIPVDWRPRSNVGVAMRCKHFITDIDVGPGKHGEESLARLIDEHGGQEMPPALEWKTGGGGRQRVTLAPEGVDVRNSASEIAPDIDIRGFNGFGVAPPSVSAKGEYIMRVDVSPDVSCPDWEAEHLRNKHLKRTEHIRSHPCSDPRQIPQDGLTRRAHGYITSAFKDSVGKVAAAEEKTRNVTLNDECFDLFSKFATAGLLSYDDIAAAMQEAGESCGLPASAVFKTIESAWNGSQRKDRSSELPDWLFEEPGDEEKPETPGRAPGITSMVYEFERLYALRRTTGGEFISRPATRDLPPLVSDIGDEMGHELRWWWRAQAEAWNEHIREMIAAAEASADEEDPKKDGEEFANPMPPDATFSTAISHLKASANRHQRVDQHLRVVDGPGQVTVDLCNDQGQVVLITAEGFEVRDPRDLDGESWFRRNGDMLAQASPADPGEVLKVLKKAQKVIGMTDEQWKVALGGLIGSYFPSISRPGWWLTGPSGVGKTTRAQFLAGWVDPVDLLGGQLDLKRDERNARTAASNSYVYSMDNVTVMSQAENDWWCRLHTGARETARKLHSDNTQLSWKFKRIGLATSLVLPAGLKPDALRRTLHVELAGTDDHPDVGAIEAKYGQLKPEMMAALFTVIAGVLAHLGKARAAKLDGIPEMADYARILYAADLAFPELGDAAQEDLGGLYAAYKAHAFEVLVRAGVEDQLALLVLGLVKRKAEDNKLKMLPAELLKALRIDAGNDQIEPWFPPDATRLGDRLTELDGPLRRLGIVVTRAKHTNRGTPYVFTKSDSPESDASDAGSDAGKGASIT